MVGAAALESTVRFQGLVLAFVGVLGLVAGTLYFGRFCRAVPPLAGATAQFLSAAIIASLCAWSLESPSAEWTDNAIAAVAWNTLMVSLGGMALYFAMLVRDTVARASANFYLVPGTAGACVAVPRRATEPACPGRNCHGVRRALARQCSARGATSECNPPVHIMRLTAATNRALRLRSP